jgi:peptide/nickel transport system substrate-binding protein
VKEAGNDPAKNVRLVRNKNYTGAAPKIERIDFALYPDAEKAEQAIDKGEIDILGLSATSDTVAKYSSKTGINVVPGDNNYIEHFDIRVGSSSSSWSSATPLQGTSVQARELRSALLMAIPRQEIVDQIIKPINRLAKVPESLLVLPTDSQYLKHVQSSNVGKYSPSGQSSATRATQALAIVKKYFPNATAGQPVIKVRILYSAINTRRADVVNLIYTSLTKAGFQPILAADASWASKLKDPNYDAMIFASTIANLTYPQSLPYCTSCINNHIGLSNPIVDSAAQSFFAPSVSISETRAALTQIENQVVSVEAASLPLFVAPFVYAVSKSLNNFKPAFNNPYPAVWNFWEWSASAVSSPTPAASKSPTPKATTKKPAPAVTKSPIVICRKPGQPDRPRIGAQCIQGWKEVRG